MHCPLTDIQAYQISNYREKKLISQTTDVAYDNNRYFFRTNICGIKKKNKKKRIVVVRDVSVRPSVRLLCK